MFSRYTTVCSCTVYCETSPSRLTLRWVIDVDFPHTPQTTTLMEFKYRISTVRLDNMKNSAAGRFDIDG